jgi:nifR3 family TIM-barrel protein
MFSSFLSPIDDYSDLPFRLLCQGYGAGAACVPLVNSTAIARDSAKMSLIDAHPDERNIGVQVVGNVPSDIGRAVRAIDEAFPFVKWYNINCGCPSVRTMESGGGSAMLAFPEKIVESVLEIKKRVDKPVSVKIRIRNNLADTLTLCKSLEKAGVDFLIIHGRTASQGYSGRADWELIKALKGRLGMPVVGNGDIASIRQARDYLKEGYCDSFMVARAAMTNPMIFCGREPGGFEERFGLLRQYIGLHRKYLAEPGLKEVRMKALNLFSSIPGAAAIRNRVCRAGSLDEILALRDVWAAQADAGCAD